MRRSAPHDVDDRRDPVADTCSIFDVDRDGDGSDDASYYDYDGDGYLSDDERDEDADGLSNFDETARLA